MIEADRGSTTIVELASGAPRGALGRPGGTGLCFVAAPAAPAPDVVPVFAAGRPISRDGHRLVAVAVRRLGELPMLGPAVPDFVVLAPELVAASGGHADGVLGAVVGYATARGIEVVALGIDDDARCHQLRRLGVRYGAGPLIERRLAGPGPARSSSATNGRMTWLRDRLAGVASAPEAAAAACDHVAELGLLPSVYVERNGLLRCIAQRGYWQVMDGIPVDKGVLGRTFRRGRTEHVDASTDGEFIEAVPGLVAELVTPLRVDGFVRAVFSVESTRPFRAEELHEIERVAGALEQALQRTGVDAEATALHVLVRADAELAGLTDEPAVAHAAVRLACQVAGTSSAMVAFPRGDGDGLVRAAAGPLAPALQRLDPIDLRALAHELGDISSCMAGGDEDGRVHPVFADVRRSGGTSLSVFPIRSTTEDPGLLFAVDQVPGGLGAEAREATELLAGTVARTLDHVRVLAALRYRAERDPLTSVGNRGAFDEAVGLLDAPGRRAERVAVLVTDIDRFKQVNDRLGHVVGDQVLVDVARAMLDCLRPEDRLYRIGGDEFAVLVPGIDLDAARLLAGRLVDRTRNQLDAVGAGMSVGIAIRAPGEPMGDCIIRADGALYDSKAGRPVG